MNMLDEGSKDLDSVEIAKRKQRLGAIIASGCGLDYCNASLNALDDQLKPSLDLFADIVRNPAFRDGDISRLRGPVAGAIARRRASHRHCAAHPAAAAVRQGACLCHPVHRFGYRGLDQVADRR
jgi:Predicted Zn-dependent peptidases